MPLPYTSLPHTLSTNHTHTGEVVSCSRDLTCVYYLTKDWTEAMGGAFVDLEADPLEEGQQASDSEEGQGEGEPSRARGNADRRASGSGRQLSPVAQQRLRVYVPEFNSAVFFRVGAQDGVGVWVGDWPSFLPGPNGLKAGWLCCYLLDCRLPGCGAPSPVRLAPTQHHPCFIQVPRYHSVTPLRTDRPRCGGRAALGSRVGGAGHACLLKASVSRAQTGPPSLPASPHASTAHLPCQPSPLLRYSVFGWYLQPGQLYELFTGQEEHPEQQRAYRQRQRATAAAGQLLLQIEQDSGGGSTQQGAEAQWGEQGQSPEEEIEPAVGADKPIAPQQCKLAQRLLARAAAKRARKQQQAGA